MQRKRNCVKITRCITAGRHQIRLDIKDAKQPYYDSSHWRPDKARQKHGELTRGGRFMKGRDLLRSAFRETTDRADCWAGAKAEADAENTATIVASFIMVNSLVVSLWREQGRTNKVV
jgi:hypothetical protein